MSAKAQRIESLKTKKNPWECLHEIQGFAQTGHASVPKEWHDVYFRWWGTYTQGNGRGVFGQAMDRYMLRIRVPNGLLNAEQLRVIAGLSRQYAHGQADLTVRQNLQLHWVRIEDMPDILARLASVGLTTKGACGDDTRNITGCPLAGLDAEEILDASELVLESTQALIGGPELYNLPRKFKITVSGCRHWCTYPEINDVGLAAVNEEGFSLRVGGGLSTTPHFGVKLDAFVPKAQVPTVLRAIAEIYRDSTELRQDRSRARLKFLFLDHGWTAESFQAELERRLGFALEPAVPERVPPPGYRDHVGIHPQKQSGLYYAGLAVLRGRITADELERIAEMAEHYGNGQVRATCSQNLVIANVDESHLDALMEDADHAGLHLEGSAFWRGVVACTGIEFCKLAVSETKSLARSLVEELEQRLPGFGHLLRINVNGCPNSCGQHWIADIGLQGCSMKIDGRRVEGFDFLLGGHTGADAAFSRRVGFRAPAEEVANVIERLLRTFLAEKRRGESLAAFCARHSDEELREFLAGEAVMAAAAPAWPGPPPHGVEG